MSATKTTAELENKLRKIKTIHGVTTAIFAVIILAWVLLGYWKTNLPVFISTVTMAAFLFLVQLASRRQISAELAARRQAPPGSESLADAEP